MVFSPDGGHLQTIGRRGDGPGEFRTIQWIQRLAGDTILVADFYNRRRLSYFTADGSFVRSSSSSSVPTPYFIGALQDGTLVGTVSRQAPAFGPGEGVKWGRARMELIRFDTDGHVLNSLGSFPRAEELVVPGLSIVQFNGWRSPLYNTLVAVGSTDIYLAAGDQFEVLVLHPDGRDREVRELDRFNPDALTPEHFVRYFDDPVISHLVRGRGVDVSAVRWDIPDGRTLPAVTDLLVDEVGNLWAEEGGRPAGPSSIWSVFTPRGSVVATMPRRFRPFHIGTESVLGVWQDELGVEYVQVRAIQR
jgi:hypothetical protein